MADLSALSSNIAGLGKVRLGVDFTFGHGPCPPIVPSTASIDVFTDQIAQVRVSDLYTPHCLYTPAAREGSLTVFTDQLMTHRFLDALTCGDRNAMGSITTFAGI